MSAEYELNEIDAADTLHGSVGSRLSLFARELKSRRSSWQSSSALRLPQNCFYGSFVIHPNGRYVTLEFFFFSFSYLTSHPVSTSS